MIVTPGSPDAVAALAPRYRLERPLGAGAVATVYLAEDLKHRRSVAVKVFAPQVRAVLGSERFLREIEILAGLSHPHILPLHDSGEAEGLLYYVMPYVAGGSLRDRLVRETQLPIGVAVRISREVAGALHYAHQRGVVHRDIKPENILLEEGHAVVSDFGIALDLNHGEHRRLTSGGFTVGTPEYMSPEQASADPAVDGRSDEYSLACVLYEMLAGQVPFVGANARAVIARQIADPAPPVSTVRPELSPGVARALHQALAKVPADRFPDVRDFAKALASGAMAESAPARSIAVLPFATLGGKPEDAYLGDGISEEIINALFAVSGLYVASRTASFAFREASPDLRRIGAALGVRTVLEGTVQVAGQRIRVTTRLVRVTDGCAVWNERFDRDFEDVLRIQDEIAECVVRSLRVVLSRDERQAIRRGRTHNPQAYAAYIRGRQFFFRFRRKSLEHARSLFRQAITLDPAYARAYAGIADCASFLYLYFFSGDEDLAEAESASRRALDLAPDLAEAHASRGLALSLRGNYDDAAREFETAARANPKLFEARYFHARAAFQEGRLEEALQLFEEACQVREDYQARLLWAQCYAALGREAEAVEAYQRARRVIEDHLELNPGDTRALMLGGSAMARLGETATATAWAERTLAIDPDDAVVLYGTACVYSMLGNADRALDLLERAVQAGFRKRGWIEHDPDFNPIRGDPRYRAILERLDRTPAP
jgi:TolB-like protein/Flp pilus assembly protein TadD/tRNA A-37 threonylcarbamoyl transferase component Bud32